MGIFPVKYVSPFSPGFCKWALKLTYSYMPKAVVLCSTVGRKPICPHLNQPLSNLATHFLGSLA